MNTIRNLMQQRTDVLKNMAQQVLVDVEHLASKAEHMAECATEIKGQGYSNFITAREEFLTVVQEFKEDYSLLVTPFIPTK